MKSTPTTIIVGLHCELDDLERLLTMNPKDKKDFEDAIKRLQEWDENNKDRNLYDPSFSQDEIDALEELHDDSNGAKLYIKVPPEFRFNSEAHDSND